MDLVNQVFGQLGAPRNWGCWGEMMKKRATIDEIGDIKLIATINDAIASIAIFQS